MFSGKKTTKTQLFALLTDCSLSWRIRGDWRVSEPPGGEEEAEGGARRQRNQEFGAASGCGGGDAENLHFMPWVAIFYTAANICLRLHWTILFAYIRLHCTIQGVFLSGTSCGSRPKWVIFIKKILWDNVTFSYIFFAKTLVLIFIHNSNNILACLKGK